MRTKRTKGYIVETSKETGVSPPQVQEVAESMFRFTAEVMSKGNKQLLDFDEVRLMKWGVFKVRPGRKKHFERLRDEKSNNTRKQRSKDRS